MATAPWSVGNDVTRYTADIYRTDPEQAETCTRQHERHDPMEEACWFLYAYILGAATVSLAMVVRVFWL